MTTTPIFHVKRDHENRPINGLSVDVEDYFQVALFENHVARQQWSTMECRVEANTDRILLLLQRHGVHATFFILGWVASRFPALVQRIAQEGHEIASHGMDHIRVTQQEPEAFYQDIVASKKLLEEISGQRVSGYRASTYSIGRDNLWALDLLHEAGYRYSSSIYPIHHDLYGMPEAPRFPHYPRAGMHGQEKGILEIPISTLSIAGMRVPCGGGGYFRLYPLFLSIWALQMINKQEDRPGVFFLHPWELDPGQPRIPGIPFKVRFRHYLNLSRMEGRLARMLDAFSWDRMDRVFLDSRTT